MKMTWKPLDLMGRRLYRVKANQNRFNGRSVISIGPDYIVAAHSPTHAARLVAQTVFAGFKPKDFSVKGEALSVLQPLDWFEQEPAVDPGRCPHDGTTLIQSSEAAGDGHSHCEAVYLCMDCGRFLVIVRKNGQSSRIEFGLVRDDFVRAAARYLRSEPEHADALQRAEPKRNPPDD